VDEEMDRLTAGLRMSSQADPGAIGLRAGLSALGRLGLPQLDEAAWARASKELRKQAGRLQKEYREKIDELREVAVLRSWAADLALEKFMAEGGGGDHTKLAELPPEDERKRTLERLSEYAMEAKEELYWRFADVDELRDRAMRLGLHKEVEVVDKSAPVVAQREVLSVYADRSVAAHDFAAHEVLYERVTATDAAGVDSATLVQPEVARDEAGSRRLSGAGVVIPSPGLETQEVSERSNPSSARRYRDGVRRIEGDLISGAIGGRVGTGVDGDGTGRADQPLSLEYRREIRIEACRRVLSEFEPELGYANDPRAWELLSLSEAVARQRDKKLPRAVEAALSLDRFIRNNLVPHISQEQLARMEAGGGLYCGADKIPITALNRLSREKRDEFELLKDNAARTRAEFEDGFREIDNLKLSIARIETDSAGTNGTGRHSFAAGAGVAYGAIEADPPRDMGYEWEMLRDRRAIGNAMIVEVWAECAERDYENAMKRGDTFRFKVRDKSSGMDRRISEHDVKRRADRLGAGAVNGLGSKSWDERSSVRERLSQADLESHSSTLEELARKRDALTASLKLEMQRALDELKAAQGRAGEVAAKYTERGQDPPRPLADFGALDKAQNEAVRHGLADHVVKLEELRQSLAAEMGVPSRDERQAARLGAHKFFMETEMAAREERLRRFDQSCHYWKFGGEEPSRAGDGRLSLAEIDRRIERLNDGRPMTEALVAGGGKDLRLIEPELPQKAAPELKSLIDARTEIVKMIGARRIEMVAEVDAGRMIIETLGGAYINEAARRKRALAPEFSLEELKRCADNVDTVRDSSLLRRLRLYERKHNEQAPEGEKINSELGWGLSPARAFMYVKYFRESEGRRDAFETHGEAQRLLIRTDGDGFITVSLRDVMGVSLIDRAARYLTRSPRERELQRELERRVEAAYAERKETLEAVVKRDRSFMEEGLSIAKLEAAEWAEKAKSQGLEPGRGPEMAFTHKHLSELEIYAVGLSGSKEKEGLLRLARGEKGRYDTETFTVSFEPRVGREVAPGKGHAR
jgi:hypothetical protein